MSSQKISGVAASSGIGIGNVCLIKKKDLSFNTSPVTDIAGEKKRFEAAVERFKVNTKSQIEDLQIRAGQKEAEILEGHLLLISDPTMYDGIMEQISAGNSSEAAVDAVCKIFIDMFSCMEDELMSQRSSDISDIRDSLLSILLDVKGTDISAVPKGTVLVAEDITPSMTPYIVKENVAGIITEVGGSTSHLAIIARAMEIPVVSSAAGITSIVKDGDTVIVDGTGGTVIICPEPEIMKKYTEQLTTEKERKAALFTLKNKETLTANGCKLELFGNIGSASEADAVLDNGGEGIGLFRTELLFMEKNADPSEEEQFEVYRSVAEKMAGSPVIIRTLDIGGDKDIPYLGLKKEANPFLGYRAIRYCLGNRHRFNRQLRAIIRASAFGNIRIMIPLVTCVEELRTVKEMVSEVKKELDNEGLEYDKDIKVGCMIETPAASLIADILAKEADFFSIGTNDLTQYTMSADRGNADVAYLNSYFQPSVLRSVKQIIQCGNIAGIPVGMCGEAASDPLMIPLLISFGLKEFSVTPALTLRCRSVINKWNKAEADGLTEKVMSLDNVADIVQALKEASKE